VDRDAIRSGPRRSAKRPSAFDASRWLAVCLALVMAVPMVLYSGHADEAAAHGIQYVVEHGHGSVASEHGHLKPCNDPAKAHHQGTCCVSAASCSLGVPVDSRIFVAASGNQPTATAPPFVSLPGEVPILRRPPKALVTA
jgi:hypothetical protein